ncbi:MAG: 3-deoxy-D-manno-octulosonic acid transferase [Psittacicella sp.]
MKIILRVIYIVIIYLIQPFFIAHLWNRGRKLPNYRKRIHERYSFYNNLNLKYKESIIIHCASVGEFQASIPLIDKLCNFYQDKNIILTCVTPTGSERVSSYIENFYKKSSKDLCIKHVYWPYDLQGATSRFIKRFNIKAVIILETEIWPNIFIKLQKKSIPIFLVNARLSENSFKNYLKGSTLFSYVLRDVFVLAQNSESKNRFISLKNSSARVINTGNIKYDINPSSQIQKFLNFKSDFNLNEKFIFVVASTHKNEEELILKMYKNLIKENKNIFLILAPRHPDRFKEVENLIKDLKISYSLRTNLESLNNKNILLLNTLGELVGVYSVANLALVCGSLLPSGGGHNPIEAISVDCPVITGKYFKNFLEIYKELLDSKASFAMDIDELCKFLRVENKETLLDMKQKSKEIYLRNKGAIDASYKFIIKNIT